jgi:hypothetical protein
MERTSDSSDDDDFEEKDRRISNLRFPKKASAKRARIAEPSGKVSTPPKVRTEDSVKPADKVPTKAHIEEHIKTADKVSTKVRTEDPTTTKTRTQDPVKVPTKTRLEDPVKTPIKAHTDDLVKTPIKPLTEDKASAMAETRVEDKPVDVPKVSASVPKMSSAEKTRASVDHRSDAAVPLATGEVLVTEEPSTVKNTTHGHPVDIQHDATAASADPKPRRSATEDAKSFRKPSNKPPPSGSRSIRDMLAHASTDINKPPEVPPPVNATSLAPTHAEQQQIHVQPSPDGPLQPVDPARITSYVEQHPIQQTLPLSLEHTFPQEITHPRLPSDLSSTPQFQLFKPTELSIHPVDILPHHEADIPWSSKKIPAAHNVKQIREDMQETFK